MEHEVGPEHTGELALFAEQAHPQLFQLSGRGRGGDRFSGVCLQLVQLVGELLQGHGGAHRLL